MGPSRGRPRAPGARRVQLSIVAEGPPRRHRLETRSRHTFLPAEVWKADEFLDRPEPGVRAELLNGERLMQFPVSTRHARLLDFLDRLVAAAFLDTFPRGNRRRDAL
ncbi:MAG: hypothetical protein JO069_11450 [Verrucomicrobia bacterium]|nr:hypothetical protein [Verrucomicrobiota bacterium]